MTSTPTSHDRSAARATATTARPATGPLARRALTAFAVLWAFAALFHQAAYPHWAFGLSALFVTLPAVWLLLRPASVGRLVLMAALQIVQVARYGFASASNHWVLATSVNAAIVLAYVWLYARRRQAPGGAALFQEFAPVARVNLAVLYFYAVFHKLNRDFLDPAVSCATFQYGELRAIYPVLPTGPWVSQAAIYGTLAVEALIPLLIFWRRTRVAGVLLAGLFHYVLALNPDHTFFDFTSVLFALYFLFVPFDYVGALRRRPRGVGRVLADGQRRRRLLAGARAILIALGILLVGAYVVRVAPNDRAVINTMAETVRALFAVYGLLLLTIFVVVARRDDVVAHVRGLDRVGVRHPLLALVPALLVANGLTPYVGLKTESSFAMFSNLRTEGGGWNHVVLPPTVRVAHYQDDLVRIVASSDPDFRREARRGRLLPFFEFRVRGGERPDASVTYERAGQVYHVARIADAPELTAPTRLQRMFLRFRAVDPPSRGQSCRH